MATKFDSRQIISRDLLAKLTGASDSELDNILRALDSELTSPLNMTASATPDLTVNVGSAIVANPETGASRSIPHVGSLLPNSFTSGTVVFSTPGGAITVTPGNDNTLPALAAAEFVQVLIYMDANGDLNVLPGVPAASAAAATVLPPPTGTLPIGYVTIEEDGAGGLNTIEQSEIIQFGTGAGGGGGAGDANSFIETLKNRLNDSIFEAVTPYVAQINQDDATLIDASSTGSFDLVTNRFGLATGETLVSANLFDADYLANFTDSDRAELVVQYDPAGVDTAATYELSKDDGVTYETVTMERVKDTSTFRGTIQFAAGTPATLALRLRITASTDDILLNGFGVLYEQSADLAFASTIEGITKSTFQAVADNTTSFVLPFLPNPDLLVVHLLGSGQSFRFGDFSLSGNTVVFPADQFNNGGVEKTQTLIFDQVRGGAFDNSDVNALLMSENGLGSSDGSIDRSSAGVGVKLRSADGTLWEVKVLNDGSIETVEVV